MAHLDFLGDGNVCGQNLLRLVSRGQAIIAELLRLSDYIPPIFYLADKTDQMKYQHILFDCAYTANQELYDSRIAADQDLIDLDEEFRETHLEILERFYSAFESIYRYVFDLLRFLEDVEEGVYIQHTVEDILQNTDGKQLLTEAFYLYGLQLTLMDDCIEGPVRERMLMAYLRYKGQPDLFSEVVNICKSTGYSMALQRRPPGYPENYFARTPLPKKIIAMIVSKLRSDDIYNQSASWPAPEHRCTALANQASMLYVILFFVPEILQKDAAAMREMVDKHFSDNWVIPYYMGYIVDLTYMWEPYKAASKALSNTVDVKNVRQILRRNTENIEPLTADVLHHLTEGVLTEEFVLDNIPKLLNLLRNCNAAVRWLMLHRCTTHKKLKLEVPTGINSDTLLVLLLQTAQLEWKLKQMFQLLLSTKQERWDKCKEECVTRMQELSQYFSGEQALTRVKRDEQLMEWFAKIASEIGQVEFHDSTLAGRKIHQLMNALQDVDQFHQIETNYQVKHFLSDTRTFLHQMLRIVNIKEEIVVTLSVVSDLAYGFNIIDQYMDLMHARVKQDPVHVLLLRATFLKMASVLDLPLVRINQAGSSDLVSVAEYYSGKLVSFVRTTLEVIPKNMFIILDHISVQARALKDIPTRLEKAQLKDYAQLDERYKLARATHLVSVFTEGILAMETTLVGVIEVDPKQMLEDGIRKELVAQISKALHMALIFRTGKLSDFEHALQQLGEQLQAFKKSFEYISDYVNVYGLKIWQEEFSRIINFNVEQECNTFLKHKIYPWQSKYQNVAIEIPTFQPVDTTSVNFVGRLMREMLLQTDPHKTLYLDARSGWFDLTGREVVGIKTFSLLHRSLGTGGMSGLDRTLSFLIVREVQTFVRVFRKELQTGLKDLLGEAASHLLPASALPISGLKIYHDCLQRIAKPATLFIEVVSRIGQAQLLRRALANELNFAARLDSNIFFSALDVLNKSVLTDVREHYRSPDERPYPDTANPLMEQLASYLDTAGINSPVLKIYHTTEALDHFPILLFLFVAAQIPRFHYDKTIGVMLPRDKKETYDAAPFVVGVLTLLKQFHSSHLQTFLALLSQYIRVLITAIAAREQKTTELPGEVTNVLYFLEDFCTYGHIDRQVVQEHVPAYIFDKFRRNIV